MKIIPNFLLESFGTMSELISLKYLRTRVNSNPNVSNSFRFKRVFWRILKSLNTNITTLASTRHFVDQLCLVFCGKRLQKRQTNEFGPIIKVLKRIIWYNNKIILKRIFRKQPRLVNRRGPILFESLALPTIIFRRLAKPSRLFANQD